MPIILADIESARERIAGHAVATPLMRSALLDETTGARVFLKAECLQRTGSFKFRGAFNRLAALSPEERTRGVVAVSSGNHAQGVAQAARLLGIKARILMPSDAPALKIARTRRDGAEVILFDRATTDRDALAAAIVAETGAVFVPPFDDPHVIAGQGTAGLEAAEELKARGETIDHVFTCCSGGGLSAGFGLAVQAFFPKAEVHPVEPVGFDDTARSLASGERQYNAHKTGSVQDALLIDTPGRLTLPLLEAMGASGHAVSDEAALKAVAFAFYEFKLVLEPGGASALAHILTSERRYAGQTLLATLSGGNIERDMLERALSL